MTSSILPPLVDPETKILTLLAHASLGRRLLPTNWVEEIRGVMRCSCMLREKPDDERICSRSKAGKHPRISQWQTRASCEQQQILEWHQWLPKANWGWLQDDTFALDVDPKRGGLESLTQWEDNAGGPVPTLLQATPSGGWHYIYAQPGDDEAGWVKVQGDVLPGIEIRGRGSYIMVDPSVGIEGQWTLQNPGILPAEPDEFTLALINKNGLVLGDLGDGVESPSEVGKKRATQHTNDLPITDWFIQNGFGGHTGSRNIDAYRLAWRLLALGDRHPDVYTTAYISSIFRRCWEATSQGDAPFLWDECGGCLKSAWARRERQKKETYAEQLAWAKSMLAGAL